MSADQKEITTNAEEDIPINKNDDKNNTKSKTSNSDINASEFIPQIVNDDDDDDEKKQKALHRTESMSSVSTHSSMPGLMSDDDSDEVDSAQDDSSLSDHSDDEIKTNINPLSDEEKQSINNNKSTKTTKKPITKNSKSKAKPDDWGATIKQGFLNRKKPKKKKKQSTKQTPKPQQTAKKNVNKAKTTANNNTKDAFFSQLRAMGYLEDTIQRVLLNTPSISTIQQFVDYVENVHGMEQKAMELRMKEEKERRKNIKGFRLEPIIDATKNATGNMFLCIGERTQKANLKGYIHLKCAVTLTKKLKTVKKTNNMHFENVMLIDLRRETNMELRDIEREKLKMGFENVVSFTCNATHGIVDVTENGERWLTLDRAFREYKETKILRKENKRVSQLVTAGFDDEEARLALQMSVEDDEEQKQEQKQRVKTVAEAIMEIAKELIEIPTQLQKEQNEDIMNAESVEDIKQSEENKEEQEDEKERKEVMVHNAEEEASIPVPLVNEEQIQMNEINVLQSSMSPKTDKAIVSSLEIDENPIQNEFEIETKPSIPAAAPQITLELMNSCKFNQRDLNGILDDPEVNDMVQGIFIKLKSNKKMYKIEKTMNRSPYTFLNEKTKKGLQISSGARGRHCKLTEVCDDAFTENELIAWKHKMQKDKQAFPDKETLYEVSERINIMRKFIDVKKNSETAPGTPALHTSNLSSQIPMSPSSPTHSGRSLQPGAYMNYSKVLMMAKYLDAIQNGYTAFWCIPTAHGDTRYCAFLLTQKAKNIPLIENAISIAKKQSSEEIVWVEIREHVVESDSSKHHFAKHGYYKSKGVLMEFMSVRAAYQVSRVLREFMVKNLKQPDHCSNICRLVLSEFGEAYIKAQKHLLKKKKKCKGAAGPKYDYYKVGEPSVETLSQIGSVCLYGEQSEYSESVVSTVID